MTSLVFILNLLSELEFFKDENVHLNFTLFISSKFSSINIRYVSFYYTINYTTFFIKIFENKEIEIFKYSGLKIQEY